MDQPTLPTPPPRRTTGALTAAAILIAVAFALSLLGPWTCVLYAPLYLASFILGIVGCAQGFPGNGLAAIILSLVLPVAVPIIQIATLAGDVLDALPGPLPADQFAGPGNMVPEAPAANPFGDPADMLPAPDPLAGVDLLYPGMPLEDARALLGSDGATLGPYRPHGLTTYRWDLAPAPYHLQATFANGTLRTWQTIRKPFQ